MGERRTIALTCSNGSCQKTFKRRVRVGTRVQCPRCKSWQDGPATREERERREQDLAQQREAKRRQRAGDGPPAPDGGEGPTVKEGSETVVPKRPPEPDQVEEKKAERHANLLW
jgi:hypothetical protein